MAVTVDLSGIVKMQARLAKVSPAAQRIAIKRALVSTARSARTTARRSIQEVYTLPVAVINDKLSVGSFSNTSFTLSASAKDIGLVSFGARDIFPRGVKVALRKGETQILKHAFQQTVQSGKQIFERQTKARYPLRRLTGPSVAGMLRNEQRQKLITDLVRSKLADEINRLLRIK